SGRDEGILDGDRAARVEIDVTPDADVAAADGGDPVPTGGGMIRGVVGAERAAVRVGALPGFLLDAAGGGVLPDAHGDSISGAGFERFGDIELAAHESGRTPPPAASR